MFPDRILKDFDLNSKEKLSIKSLDKVKINSYARSLILKRFKKVKTVFPLITKVIGKEKLLKIFIFYSQLNIANCFSRKEEIKRFAGFLSQELMTDSKVSPFISDLIRFEETYFMISADILRDLDDEEI